MKLARRLSTLTTELKGEGRASALAVPTGSFAALPNPLRTVAASLPAGSSGLATCQALAAKLTAQAAPAAFTGADAVYAPQTLDPAAAPNPDDPKVATFAQEIDT